MSPTSRILGLEPFIQESNGEIGYSRIHRGNWIYADGIDSPTPSLNETT